VPISGGEKNSEKEKTHVPKKKRKTQEQENQVQLGGDLKIRQGRGGETDRWSSVNLGKETRMNGLRKKEAIQAQICQA